MIITRTNVAVFLSLAGVIAVCLMMLMACTFKPLYALLAFFVFVWFLSDRKILIKGAIILMFSKLLIPGLPGNVMLYQFVIMVWLCLVFAESIIKFDYAGWPAYAFPAFIFLLNMGAVILVRGFGIKVFGGNEAGGMIYIQSATAFLFFLNSKRVVLTVKEWKSCFFVMCLLSFISFFASAVLFVSQGAIWQQFKFIAASQATQLQYSGMMAESGSHTRMATFSGLIGVFWIPIILGRFSQNIWMRILYAVAFTAAFIFALLSSYRSVMISTFATLALFIFLSRKNKSRIIVYFLTGGIIFAIIATLRFDSLPYSVQRVLSLLPWLKGQSVASMDAQNTMEWRYILWRSAWNLVPEYWVVGRGLTFDMHLYTALARHHFSLADSTAMFLLSGSFHLGALELLVALGVVGLLSYMCFIALQIIQGIKLVSFSRWESVELHRLYTIWFCLFISSSLLNLIVGLSQPLLVSVPIYLGIMTSLRFSDSEQGHSKDIFVEASGNEMLPSPSKYGHIKT